MPPALLLELHHSPSLSQVVLCSSPSERERWGVSWAPAWGPSSWHRCLPWRGDRSAAGCPGLLSPRQPQLVRVGSHHLPPAPPRPPLQPGGDALLPACPFPNPAVGRGWGSEERCWEAAGSHGPCRGSCSRVWGGYQKPLEPAPALSPLRQQARGAAPLGGQGLGGSEGPGCKHSPAHAAASVCKLKANAGISPSAEAGSGQPATSARG